LNHERKVNGFLTQKRFEKTYGRLGTYLLSDNPWGDDKEFVNFASEFPSLVEMIHGLLSLHLTAIITSDFKGIWIVESDSNFSTARIITTEAGGEFEFTN
jgi:hypothetical protein